ncbi:hypothetical protein OEA41_009302 [Lepraria neglecta]|uniref:Uncharacterized protein n=1 Tax=Lepraria neglecta TaxID=209136 RepID=A0AAE0DK27_9LECA|nr:hypothetical protein OEA41_009302 [Lepraria neglecta]
MATSTSNSEAISNLIQRHEPSITHRATRVANHELSTWTVEQVAGVMERLTPRPKRAGSNEPCGPEFNRHSPIFKWLQIPVWSIFAIGTSLLVPMQLSASIYLLAHGRLEPIWKELPTPTLELFDWSRHIFTFVKAPLYMVRKSIEQEAALCVNRLGGFEIKTEGYAVLSHVWEETMGWSKPDSWGPIEVEARKQGIFYGHFIKFFDRCDAEWLWVDALAMPEVFDDMTAEQKADTEELRTGVINSLRKIYTRADKVVCLDSLLMRTRTGGMIDVAVMLALSRWIQRLWPFTEAKLAKRVVLKTEDSSFDLDAIIKFLFETINNQDHRYFPLILRLIPLRPMPPGQRIWIGSPLRPEMREPNLFVDIYTGCENRFCDVEIDQARALFPVLDLKWVTGWTLQRGLKHIADSYPDEKDILLKYCDYRRIDFSLSESSDLLLSPLIWGL